MKNAIKNIIMLLLLIGILISPIVDAYTFIGTTNEGGPFIINIREKTYFEELFGIITFDNPSVRPGENLNINLGLEIGRVIVGTSFVSIALGPVGGGPGFASETVNVPSYCAFSSCLIELFLQVPSSTSPGTYAASYEARDSQGFLDRGNQQFTVYVDTPTCPASTWGPYSDFSTTSDGNGIIKRSTRNVYDSQCKLTNVQAQYYTYCSIGYYITGQSTSVTSYPEQNTCTAILGQPQQPICGNGIIDASEYCDGTNLGGSSCSDFGKTGTIKCKSDCSYYDTSQCISTTNGGGTGTNQCGTTQKGFGCPLPAETELFGETITEVQWAYEAQCLTGICLNTIVGQGGTCETPICCQTGDNFNVKKEGESCSNIVELSKCGIKAENICKLSGVGGGTGTTTTTGETEIELHKGISPSKVKSSTTEDLIESSCTQNKQCESGSTCNPLSWYIDKGYLTEEDAKGKIEETRARIIGTSLGASLAAGGALAGAKAIGLCTAATALSAGIAGPICFGTVAVAGLVTGAVAGDYIVELFTSVNEKDINKFGYCTIEKTGNFFEDPIFTFPGTDFQVTGLYLILGIVGLLVLLNLIPKRS